MNLETDYFGTLNEFKENKKRYEELSNSLQSLITSLLNRERIRFHKISSRIKGEESIIKKLKKTKLKINEIQDLIGIRIIAYLVEDVEKIEKIIQEEFEIDNTLTKDYSKILERDRVGYTGKNYVAKLGKFRRELREWENYKDLRFEIQIHTILGHAWSEIQHDRNYKFVGKIPKEIERKFNLLAGSLELLDLNFNELCKKIDNYEENIKQELKEGRLGDIEIDSISLRIYLTTKFEEEIMRGILIKQEDEDVFLLATQAIESMGLINLKQMNNLIDDLPLKEYFLLQTKITLSNLVSDILMMKFKEKFLTAGIDKKWGDLVKKLIFKEKEVDFFKMTIGLNFEEFFKDDEKQLKWKVLNKEGKLIDFKEFIKKRDTKNSLSFNPI